MKNDARALASNVVCVGNTLLLRLNANILYDLRGSALRLSEYSDECDVDHRPYFHLRRS